MRRVICLGNRLVPGDDAGPRVYDRLAGVPLPPGVEVIDGGLAGLNLLRLVEGAEQVIFVDAVQGSCAAGGVEMLDAEQVASTAEVGFDHRAGLAYLLRVLPRVCAGPLPRVGIVGIGTPIDGGVDDGPIKAAATLALQLVGAWPRDAVLFGGAGR